MILGRGLFRQHFGERHPRDERGGVAAVAGAHRADQDDPLHARGHGRVRHVDVALPVEARHGQPGDGGDGGVEVAGPECRLHGGGVEHVAHRELHAERLERAAVRAGADEGGDAVAMLAQVPHDLDAELAGGAEDDHVAPPAGRHGLQGELAVRQVGLEREEDEDHERQDQRHDEPDEGTQELQQFLHGRDDSK